MLKLAKKTPIIIMSIAILVMIFSSASVMASETEELPDRLIGENDKVWTLNLPLEVESSVVEKSVVMKASDGSEQLINIESEEETNNFLISPQSEYLDTEVYTLSVGKEVFESYNSPREKLEITFKKVDMDVQIEEGLTIFQRLVKITLPEEYSGNYDVSIKDKKMTYKEEIDMYLALVDSSDEADIRNSISIVKQSEERQAKE